MNFFEQIYGCLAGLALGDSLGCPTEFLTREQIKSEYGWVEHFVRAPDWHPHHILLPGQITDDTGQVLSVAHALDSDGLTSAEEIAKQLIIWADQTGENLELIIGPSTRQALEQIRIGESPRLTGRNGTTNGAAYRGVIPGLMNHHQPRRMMSQVVEVCLPTHGTMPAISGASAIAFAIAQALPENTSLDEIIRAGKNGAQVGHQYGEWAWTTPLDKRIELAIRLVSEKDQPEEALSALADFVGTDMLVSESVASVFGVVAIAQGDPMKAIQYGANIGGDTDTIAALAGAICGAWKGIDAIDQTMLSHVERVNQINIELEALHLVEKFK